MEVIFNKKERDTIHVDKLESNDYIYCYILTNANDDWRFLFYNNNNRMYGWSNLSASGRSTLSWHKTISEALKYVNKSKTLNEPRKCKILAFKNQCELQKYYLTYYGYIYSRKGES